MGRGRPAWLFSAAPEVGFEPGARGYAGLASALAAHIARTSRQPRADSIEAGLLWGRGLVRRSTATEVVTPAQASAPTVVASEGAGPGPKEPDAVSARREVITLLEELGFAPSPDARAGVVKLRRCPLLKAAHQHPAVVCGVHLGVVRGALDELGADPRRNGTHFAASLFGTRSVPSGSAPPSWDTLMTLDPPTPMALRDRTRWHLGANAPVAAWLAALLAVTLFRPYVAESPWLLVHLLLLGAVTNAIFVWSAHFADALLRRRATPGSRRWQAARMVALNVGVVTVVAGMVGSALGP